MGAMAYEVRPRILFIDAYDSFSNNIISLLQTDLDVDVTVIKIDEPIKDFTSFLKPFSAVVAGPGPGHPKTPGDVGWFNELWALKRQDLLPIMGICLGFQSLVLAFGGKVEELSEPRHGILRKIRSNGQLMFTGLVDITSVQYHSLYASIGSISEGDMVGDKHMCPDLRPLAWDLELDNPSMSNAPPNKNPEAILMAVAHASRPFYGIQFHPESICSNANARKIISRWWMIAQSWNQLHRHQAVPMLENGTVTRRSPCFDVNDPSMVQGPTTSRPTISAIDGENRKATCNTNGSPTVSTSDQNVKNGSCVLPRTTNELAEVKVFSQSLVTTDITVPDVCEVLQIQNEQFILLDSELHQRPIVGISSILGIVAPTSLRLEYNIGTNQVRHVQNGNVSAVDLESHGGTIFSYLKSFMKQHRAEGGDDDVPFWGGLMGYITYEACLETIDIPTSQQRETPDLSFVFVERSIVFDHRRQKIHVQSIKPNDWEWVCRTLSCLQSFRPAGQKPASITPFPTRISLPNEEVYKSKIRDCQTSLRQGHSYELCLTTQCTVQTPRSLSPWSLYLRLRQHNSAPFAAYLRLGPLTLLSSSPERFLCWSRPAVANPHKASKPAGVSDHIKTSTCQFRPIKGTVHRKPKDPTAQPVTLAEATAILSTDKERAENLMIVDLIRHDLHGVVGFGNVHVRKLMVVEAYATLYQLVTVIEGTLHIDDDDQEEEDPRLFHFSQTGLQHQHHHQRFDNTHPDREYSHPVRQAHRNHSNNKTGIDVLAASLPPGSMTGAPKRRSCALLQKLEQGRERGVYSGVVGYLDAGGGGDFSVVIRSAFRWDPESESESTSLPSSSLAAGAPAGSSPRTGEDNSSGPPLTNGDGTHKLDGSNGSTRFQGEEKKDEAEAAAVELAAQPWIIGAGGAVTCLSTEEGEWEEMQGKMRSTMGVFGGTGWKQ
ncbi:para-aminobenzoate synthase, (PABA) [Pseudocyphellaria aurata]|nr:para-aminobenzoate synthase, (PABA) [Pseudocyphellaria aurata]